MTFVGHRWKIYFITNCSSILPTSVFYNLCSCFSKLLCVSAAKNSPLPHINCKSCWIVYLITCTQCGKQYVSKTERSLYTRFSNTTSETKDFNNSAVCRCFSDKWHNHRPTCSDSSSDTSSDSSSDSEDEEEVPNVDPIASEIEVDT